MTQETKDLMKDITAGIMLVVALSAVCMMFVGMGF